MRISRTAALVAAACLAASFCQAQEKEGNSARLKFLEPMVGQWQVAVRDADQVRPVGATRCQWIFERNFLRHDGWRLVNDKPVEYVAVTGWNGQTEEVFWWVAGGSSTFHGIQQWIGTYNPQEKAFSGSLEATYVGEGQHTSAFELRFVDPDSMTIDFTDSMFDGQPSPNQQEVHLRNSRTADPEVDDTPGPAYEHLEPLGWLVGDWKIEGQWADGVSHVGEEHSEWAYNRNFIQGEGWWRDREGERIDYLFMIA